MSYQNNMMEQQSTMMGQNGMVPNQDIRAMYPFQLPAAMESDFSAEDMAADMDGMTMTFQRVKIPSGGMLQFEMPTDDPDNPDYTRVLTGVILHNHTSCAFWAEGNDDEENNPPVCSSLDGKTGIGLPGGACSACEMNRFGSAAKGRGKACKNMRVIYLLRSGDYMPLQINLPPTSIRGFNDFISSAFVMRRRASFGSMVQIGLKKGSNGKDEYSIATFKRLYDFCGEELAQIRAYAMNFKEQLNQMHAQQMQAMADQNEDIVEYADDENALPMGEEPFVMGPVIDGDREALPE